MKHLPITLGLTLCACTCTFSNSFLESWQQNYLDFYGEIAVQEMQRSNIPASIILAQAILESSWGQGELALNSNNFFGIKCKSEWEGAVYFKEDDDYENGRKVKSCFRSYEAVYESFIDHTDFILYRERYRDLFKYETNDYINWAKGLKRCGYATDPNYATKLIDMIEKYNLDKYDQSEHAQFTQTGFAWEESFQEEAVGSGEWEGNASIMSFDPSELFQSEAPFEQEGTSSLSLNPIEETSTISNLSEEVLVEEAGWDWEKMENVEQKPENYGTGFVFESINRNNGSEAPIGRIKEIYSSPIHDISRR